MYGFPTPTPSIHAFSLLPARFEYILIKRQNNWSINPAPAYLASYAYDIEQSCTEVSIDPGVWLVGGQEGDTDGYAVWVLGWNGQGGHGC